MLHCIDRGEALLASCMGCGRASGAMFGVRALFLLAFFLAGSLRRFQPMHKKELVIQVSFPAYGVGGGGGGAEGRAPRFSFSDCSLSLSLFRPTVARAAIRRWDRAKREREGTEIRWKWNRP